MKKLKANKDVVIPIMGTLKSGSVINNISTDSKNISFKDKEGATYTIGAKDFSSSFDSVPDETAENVVLEKSKLNKDITSGVESFGRGIQIGGGLGLLGGLGLAYYRKSGVGGYIGWGILLSLVGSIVGGYMGGKKAISDATK